MNYSLPTPKIWAPGMYIKEQGSESVMIKGFEIPVPLPKRPPMHLMENYGKPEEEQKYERLVIPADFDDWDFQDQEEFINRMFHIRLHGRWWLIKGKQFYLPGTCEIFCSFWHMETGELPTFRIEAVEFFQVWDLIEHDKDCFGLLDVKARRIGDTEKFGFLEWEWATRHRFQWCGMQNTTDTDAQEAFDRIVQAHRQMPFFFKPKMDGTDSPKKAMIFRYKPQMGSINDREKTLSLNHVGSRIDFKPTKLKAYDGKRLGRYRMEEWGKILPTEMHVKKQWEIVKLCLSTQNGAKIVGKAGFPSTVEEMKNGETVEIAREMWDESDPTAPNKTGRTTSGLYRILRNFEKGAPVDEYGFHLVEEERKRRQELLDDYMAKGKLDEASSLKRKLPDTIEDALAIPAEDCILLPALLDQQITMLNWLALSESTAAETAGDLMWTNGFGSNVMFVPNPYGKFKMSQAPEFPNNKIGDGNGTFGPGNSEMYAIGLDPIDHSKPIKKGSKGGISVYRPYDQLAETEVGVFDEDGEIVDVSKMRTDQFVMTYQDRPQNPYDFYEDALKIMIFYGAKAFIESDKPGIINYLQDKGFGKYLAFKPHTVAVGTRRHSKTPGAKASTPVINAYIESLKTHVAERWQTYKHLDLLNDYRKFNGENRTVCDLAVSAGYALLLGRRIEKIKKTNSNKKAGAVGTRVRLYSKDGNIIEV